MCFQRLQNCCGAADHSLSSRPWPCVSSLHVIRTVDHVALHKACSAAANVIPVLILQCSFSSEVGPLSDHQVPLDD